MFYEQLEKLCKKQNTSPTAVVQGLGMSKGSISNWKKGGTPNGEVVVRFAELFSVSTDYLLTGKDFSQSNLNLNANDQELLDLFHQLPERNQIKLIGYVERLVEENNSVAADDSLPEASGN